MYRTDQEILQLADDLLASSGTRDPYALAAGLGITVMPRDFHSQRGVYMRVLGHPFIFIKRDLSPTFMNIVLLHEIGHHCLHQEEALEQGGLSEVRLFGRNGRMEYEANLFAARILLPEDDLLSWITQGFTLSETAKAMHTDPNLVAIAVNSLIKNGHHLLRQEAAANFLKSSYSLASEETIPADESFPTFSIGSD